MIPRDANLSRNFVSDADFERIQQLLHRIVVFSDDTHFDKPLSASP